jgi:hypothetical protein
VNVLNVYDIERETVRVASHAIHTAAQEWVKTVARNYLFNSNKDLASNFRVYSPDHPALEMPRQNQLPAWAIEALQRGEVLHWFDPVQVRRRPFWHSLEHIVDWFNSWPATDTRLRRLNRINFMVAATAAGLWMKNVTNNLWDYVQDKPPIIHAYEEGFHWVRLVTNLHFERESKMMNHCVGNGQYYSMYKRGEMEYYSLRDKGNNPHCTVEVGVRGNSRYVLQCKGNSNQKPDRRYQRYIQRFFNDMQWPVSGDQRNID